VVRRPPRQGRGEQQRPAGRGPPVPGPDHDGQGRDDPHPVMAPGDGRHQQPADAGRRRAAQPVTAAGQGGGGGQPDGAGRERQDQVPARQVADPAGDPADRAEQGLVADVGRVDAPDVVEQARPVQAGGVRGDAVAGQPAAGEGGGGDGRGPGPPGQQEEHHEDGGRQLHRGRQPDADPGGPPGRRPAHVGQHERQQEQVDLAQVERVVHRLQQQAAACDGGQHPGLRRPAGRPAAGQLQRDLDRPGQRGD
jgi:hypothetical protein